MIEMNNVAEENEIRKLMDEVEFFRKAIEDARDALATAEAELATALDDAYEKEQN